MKKPFAETKVGKFFQKPAFKKYVAPAIRGIIKQVPFVGNPISEIIENVTQSKIDKVRIPAFSTELVEVDKAPKHTTVSIVVQIVLAALVIYAFFSKTITVRDAVDIVKSIFGI